MAQVPMAQVAQNSPERSRSADAGLPRSLLERLVKLLPLSSVLPQYAITLRTKEYTLELHNGEDLQ